MPQKIKILSLRKTEEYIKKELDNLKARRNKLLISSDWTQIIDNGLSMKNILEWRYWRNKIRNIKCNNISNLLEIENEISFYEENRPQVIKRNGELFKFIINDFDYSSLEKFKKSCILIIKDCVSISKNKRFDALERADSMDTAFQLFLHEI